MPDRTSKLDQLRIDREPEKSTSSLIWISIALSVILAAGVAVWLLSVSGGTLEVETTTVRETRGATTSTVLNASGYVTARRQATVSSEVTGKVVEVLIEEGMAVEEGQVLARLDDRNIRAGYELAEAQLFSARTSLKETEALLDEARRSAERTASLVERELASEAQLDHERAVAGSLAAVLERKKADIGVAEKGLEVWSRQIEDTIIRSPFAGIVVAKNAQPGEMISPMSAGGGFTRTGIGTIVDMDSLEIEIDVNEAYINRISAGQKVTATLDAYPDWRISCHVIAIIPTADRQRATVEVRVGFEELDARILPDMGVKVAFQQAQDTIAAKPALSIPETAVRRDGGRDIVFVVNDGVVERRAVSVSERRDGTAMLSAGLTAGEVVVTVGPAELADGSRVKERGK